MHQRSYLVHVFIAIVTLLLLSCSDDGPPTQPHGNDDTTGTAGTTSHDFVWEKMQIGVRHTVLRAVEAISDTDVWVGGDIRMVDTYTYDSLGNYISPMNAAHWDGKEWTIQRITFPHYGSVSTPGYSEISSIKAFGPRDVWFSAGGALAHWDGENFRTWLAPEELAYAGYMAHMDGTPGNLYFAGYDGAMMRFDGQGFHKIQTGTDQDINDLCLLDGELMAVANNINDLSHPKPVILRIGSGPVKRWTDPLMYEGVTSLWFADSGLGYICGPGLRRYENGTWTLESLPRRVFLYYLRGTAANDIFLAGDAGVLYHYNGKDWRYFPEFDSGEYLKPHGMTYKDGNLWTVWTDAGQRSYVTHGRRVGQ